MPGTTSELRTSTALPAGGRGGPWLVRAERRTFPGSAAFLDDPANRADLEAYLADLTRPYPSGASAIAVAESGQSYGEMAEALIRTVVPGDQPVGLLVLAYAVHDVQPGRATATYLSSVCPGTPLSFAISDQGSAAAFSGLRIVRDYLASPAGTGSAGAGRRALLIVAEQAGLPYPSGPSAVRPEQHRGLAMLFDAGDPAGSAGSSDPAGSSGPVGSSAVPSGAIGRLAGLWQRPNLAADGLAEQATADLAELSAGYRRVRVVASPALAAAWAAGPDRPDELRVGPAGQPATGVWWQLLDELAAPDQAAAPGRPDLLVAADYDPELGYLCLAGFEAGFEAGTVARSG